MAFKANHSIGRAQNASDAITSLGEMWKVSMIDLLLVLLGEALRLLGHRLKLR